VAPVLTLVVGGNHEASNYFLDLFHGGWLAPNIYFLGMAGAVRLLQIRKETTVGEEYFEKRLEKRGWCILISKASAIAPGYALIVGCFH